MASGKWASNTVRACCAVAAAAGVGRLAPTTHHPPPTYLAWSFVAGWVRCWAHIGEGTFSYDGGDYYTGSWAAGVKHGQGVYFYSDSFSQLYGYWSCNTFIGGAKPHSDSTDPTLHFSDGRFDWRISHYPV